MTQQPKRLPGEGNPIPDANAPMQPLRKAQSLGMESLAMGAGAGGPLSTFEGGIVKGIIAFVNGLKRRRAAKGTR